MINLKGQKRKSEQKIFKYKKNNFLFLLCINNGFSKLFRHSRTFD